MAAMAAMITLGDIVDLESDAVRGPQGPCRPGRQSSHTCARAVNAGLRASAGTTFRPEFAQNLSEMRQPEPARTRSTPCIDGAAIEILERGTWYAALPAGLKAQIVRRAEVREHARRSVIIQEGAPTLGVHAVLEGRVRIVRHIGAQRREVVVHVGESGLWFGLFALSAGSRSVGSVIAATRVRTLFLSSDALEQIFADEPAYFRPFAEHLFQYFAYLFRYAAESQALAPEGWLRMRLADLAALRRRDDAATGPVTLSVSQSELATMVGVSRQTLNGLLRRLASLRLIDVRFRRIVVLDEAGLRGTGAERAAVEPAEPA